MAEEINLSTNNFIGADGLQIDVIRDKKDKQRPWSLIRIKQPKDRKVP